MLERLAVYKLSAEVPSAPQFESELLQPSEPQDLSYLREIYTEVQSFWDSSTDDAELITVIAPKMRELFIGLEKTTKHPDIFRMVNNAQRDFKVAESYANKQDNSKALLYLSYSLLKLHRVIDVLTSKGKQGAVYKCAKCEHGKEYADCPICMEKADRDWGRLQNAINNPEDRNEKNTYTYKGKPFWSGIADARDGYIIEVHCYEEAESADWHHSLYVSPESQTEMRDGNYLFFWMHDGKVETDWREGEAPANIVQAISEQIQPRNKIVDTKKAYGNRDVSGEVGEVGEQESRSPNLWDKADGMDQNHTPSNPANSAVDAEAEIDFADLLKRKHKRVEWPARTR